MANIVESRRKEIKRVYNKMGDKGVNCRGTEEKRKIMRRKESGVVTKADILERERN